MKHKPLVIVYAILIAGLPATLLGASCNTSDPVDTVCTQHVDQVRPTQFAVGSVAVTCKAQDIAEKSKKKLKKYLKNEKRQIPVVVGPDGGYYMTDHHHLSTALSRAMSSKWGDDAKVLHLKILENYSTQDVSWGEFWEAMKKANQSYNYDNKGTPDMNFALLPTNVKGLLNDPYRTLSRWVRESCGYVKAGKEQCDAIRPDPAHEAPFFMEFFWGDFFRKNLPLEIADLAVCESIPYSETCLEDEVGQLKGILSKAMELAGSEQAKQYFLDQGLAPMAYGFNPTGEHLELTWSGYHNACEEPVLPASD